MCVRIGKEISGSFQRKLLPVILPVVRKWAFFFLPHHRAACEILALRSGIKPVPHPATVEAWSLNHQGGPCLSIIDDDFI